MTASEISHNPKPTRILFGNISIKYKLILMVMLVTSITILFSGGAWISYEWYMTRTRMAEDTTAAAAMVAENCSAALAFNDSQDAAAVLSSLHFKISVQYVAVYDKNGKVFATYKRNPSAPNLNIPIPSTDKYYFTKDYLFIWHSITLGQQNIGTLLVQSNLTELKVLIKNSLAVLLIMTSLALLIALLCAIRLQRIITTPLSHLTDLADLISQKKDYSVRAEKHNDDELGLLTEAFNSMLTQVEKRDSALRESQERFRSVIKHAPVIIWVLSEEGIFTFMEGHAKKPFGQSPDSFMGKSIFELFADNDEIVTSSQKALDGTAASASFMIDEISYDIRYMPLQDSPDKTIGAIGVAIDVTKQKKAVNERLRLVSAIEHAAEDIIITNTKGIIEYVNPAFERITGYSRAEAIGKKPNILHSGMQDKKFYEKMWNKLNNKQVWTGRIINKKKDGTLVHEDATVSPIFDSSGADIGYVSVKRDVTEQLKSEEMLRQSQKMEAIGTLAGGIAHDFNNILSAIFGFTEMAILGIPTESKEHEDLLKVLTSAERARDLVKQILTFSRMRELEPQPVQVQKITQETLKLIVATFPSTIKIEENFRSNAVVMADPTQLHQILMNLLTNAAHAMRQRGGVLKLRLAEIEMDRFALSGQEDIAPGKFIQLTVGDTGHGMKAEIRDRIFDPFFTTKNEAEGTGMGLSVVHGIVRSFGGFITVYSEPDIGTTFNIFLPIFKQDKEAEIVPIQELPGGNERILLIDDEELIIEVGRTILEHLGYQVTIFSDPAKALQEFSSRPTEFDLVITDITMPKLTGDILTQKILALKPDLPIIMCTGYHSEITEKKAKSLGAYKLVTKPLVQKDMALLVRSALDENKNEGKIK